VPKSQPHAHFGRRRARGLQEVSHDPAVLDGGGWWAVVVDFEGGATFARFADVDDADIAWRPWPGVVADAWTSSMSQAAYEDAVRTVRDQIAEGFVYQANICRVLSAPLPDGVEDLTGLAWLLAARQAAPFTGLVCLPDQDVHVASGSPELYLRREGERLTSAPIKGTGRTEDDLLDKDTAENVMIVDLVRNDLGRVCRTGSVSVPHLLAVEEHPGLVHLVSTVAGDLRPGVGWADILAATFPPGSVSGAPKHSALQVITALETSPRGPYCGAVGWVDADRGEAELAVGIRTFFTRTEAGRRRLCFGTGAGITWGSDPDREWDETMLKAERLLAVAALDAETERTSS
jgi:para-aminobenzoate synthetase component I